jgi:hypothetical protein
VCLCNGDGGSALLAEKTVEQLKLSSLALLFQLLAQQRDLLNHPGSLHLLLYDVAPSHVESRELSGDPELGVARKDRQERQQLRPHRVLRSRRDQRVHSSKSPDFTATTALRSALKC